MQSRKTQKENDEQQVRRVRRHCLCVTRGVYYCKQFGRRIRTCLFARCLLSHGLRQKKGPGTCGALCKVFGRLANLQLKGTRPRRCAQTVLLARRSRMHSVIDSLIRIKITITATVASTTLSRLSPRVPGLLARLSEFVMCSNTVIIASTSAVAKF